MRGFAGCALVSPNAAYHDGRRDGSNKVLLAELVAQGAEPGVIAYRGGRPIVRRVV
jgi:hypothetical protein